MSHAGGDTGHQTNGRGRIGLKFLEAILEAGRINRHEEIWTVSMQAVMVNANQIGMIQPGHCPRFVQEPLARALRETFAPNQLQGELAIERIADLEYDSHAATTQRGKNRESGHIRRGFDFTRIAGKSGECVVYAGSSFA